MRRTLVAVVAVVGALRADGLRAGKSDTIPDSFVSRNAYRQAPLWVALSKAADPAGILRADVLAPAELQRFRAVEKQVSESKARTKQTAAADGACDITYRAPNDDAPDLHPSLTWAEVVAEAAGGRVFSGRVAAARIGLYAGVPFTMIAVDVLSSSEMPLPYVVYLLYPSGSATISGVCLCMIDERYRALPATGERIAWIATRAIDAEGLVYRIPAERIFIERASELEMPTRAFLDAATVPSSFDALERALLAARDRTPVMPEQNKRADERSRP